VFRIESLVPATVAEGIDAFVDQMRQLGYEEGRNLVFDRHVVETTERNAALAAELVALSHFDFFSLASACARETKKTQHPKRLAVTLFVPAITKSARSVAISEGSPNDPTT
jgi:hypothetical protein